MTGEKEIIDAKGPRQGIKKVIGKEGGDINMLADIENLVIIWYRYHYYYK